MRSRINEICNQMIANGELSMKSFLKETVIMALDALERIITITCLEVTAKNLAATAPLSFIGAAKAALQVAAIKAAFAVVKGLVSNFYTGGYTGPGDWDKPQGIVHSNEFVANRFAVANPAVRPVLDLIDSAQRSGTIANLTTADIAAVAGGQLTGSAQPPMVVQSASQPNDPELKQTVRALHQVISRLVVRLDEPIEAIGVISGRHGWKQKLDDYDQLLNNKSRK
ncbi:MAG: phage tail tape measure protein, partial [Parabacteroides sp.]|nr:phage tail tape measure protein [Parabacteroides sp.]